MILLWFPIIECPLMLAVSPFYSVILGFGVPLILPSWLGTRAPVMLAILMASSFPVSHSFPLFVPFP